MAPSPTDLDDDGVRRRSITADVVDAGSCADGEVKKEDELSTMIEETQIHQCALKLLPADVCVVLTVFHQRHPTRVRFSAFDSERDQRYECLLEGTSPMLEEGQDKDGDGLDFIKSTVENIISRGHLQLRNILSAEGIEGAAAEGKTRHKGRTLHIIGSDEGVGEDLRFLGSAVVNNSSSGSGYYSERRRRVSVKMNVTGEGGESSNLNGNPQTVVMSKTIGGGPVPEFNLSIYTCDALVGLGFIARFTEFEFKDKEPLLLEATVRLPDSHSNKLTDRQMLSVTIPFRIECRIAPIYLYLISHIMFYLHYIIRTSAAISHCNICNFTG